MGTPPVRGFTSWAVVAGVASVLVAVGSGGCGSSSPSFLGSINGSTVAVGVGGDSGTSSDTIDISDNSLPGCGVGVDGGVCGCSDLAPLGTPPNLYYVLDRSGSMADGGKWTAVRTVVSNVMVALGPRALFGATVFPSNASSDECASGDEVFPLTLGDSPAGTSGPHDKALLAAMDIPPVGGTPTAATLAALIPKLLKLSGQTFVILATDGGPNCSGATSCDAASCVLNIESDNGCSPTTGSCCTAGTGGGDNCLDTENTVEAITALHNAGIPTYVIGIPGSAPYQSVLDQFAVAGGTSRGSEPEYYAVDSTDQTAIGAALSTVAAKIVGTCAITLSAAPPDPGLVNVYFDEALVPQDPVNGWTLDGATVNLVGTSCQQVLSGEILDVRVIAGCPTVLR